MSDDSSVDAMYSGHKRGRELVTAASATGGGFGPASTGQATIHTASTITYQPRANGAKGSRKRHTTAETPPRVTASESVPASQPVPWDGLFSQLAAMQKANSEQMAAALQAAVTTALDGVTSEMKAIKKQMQDAAHKARMSDPISYPTGSLQLGDDLIALSDCDCGEGETGPETTWKKPRAPSSTLMHGVHSATKTGAAAPKLRIAADPTGSLSVESLLPTGAWEEVVSAVCSATFWNPTGEVWDFVESHMRRTVRISLGKWRTLDFTSDDSIVDIVVSAIIRRKECKDVLRSHRANIAQRVTAKIKQHEAAFAGHFMHIICMRPIGNWEAGRRPAWAGKPSSVVQLTPIQERMDALIACFSDEDMDRRYLWNFIGALWFTGRNRGDMPYCASVAAAALCLYHLYLWRHEKSPSDVGVCAANPKLTQFGPTAYGDLCARYFRVCRIHFPSTVSQAQEELHSPGWRGILLPCSTEELQRHVDSSEVPLARGSWQDVLPTYPTE